MESTGGNMSRAFIYPLTCLLFFIISFNVDAKVENTGTKNIEIWLLKDNDIKKGFRYPITLINIKDPRQDKLDNKYYYELKGFKTKESLPFSVKLFNSHNDEFVVEFNKESKISKSYNFKPTDTKHIELEFQSDYDSELYNGNLTIYSYFDKSPYKINICDISFKIYKPRNELIKSILLAVFVLFFGVLISYSVTRKIIVNKIRYDRKVLIKRIEREVEDDFKDDNLYLKERIRALLSITSNMNNSWVFISKEKTEEYLNLAEYLLKVGKQKSEIWHRLQNNVPQGLIEEASKHLKEIDRLVSKFDVMANNTEINELLGYAGEYTKEDKKNYYWPILKERIEALIFKIGEVNKLPVSPLNDYIKELMSTLITDKDKELVLYNELQDIELNQRKLDLIWENKHSVKLNNKLIDTMRKDDNEGLERARYILQWEVENEKNWVKIKENCEVGKVKIQPPSYLVKNEVGVFTIDLGNERLNSSYLARKYLAYDWEFKFFGNSEVTDSALILKSTNMCNNTLSKFLTKEKNWKIELTITYENGSRVDTKIINTEIQVGVNEETKRIRQVSKVEMSLSFGALFFAVLTGLESKVFNNSNFGSLSDFATLFMWSIAFDQGKNFIQWFRNIGKQS